MTRIIMLIYFVSLSFLSSAQLRKMHKDLPCIDKEFQVQAHVMLDSLGVANYTPQDLEADLDLANSYFKDICVSFALCGIDTIYNYEYDSIGTSLESQEMNAIFHKKNRINIFLATELDEPGKCGFATLAGVNSTTNGDVFLKCQGTTIVHELGHLFGLSHTFGGMPELADGSNCESTGDEVCDTPADPFIEGSDLTDYIDTVTCEFISLRRDANSTFYQPDVGNIMSYYSGCECGFTREQYLKMVETYLSSDTRLW